MIKPINDRVLIKKPEKTNELESGIILPDDAGTENNQKGEIIAIGEKVEYVKNGQNVIYNKYSGTELHVDDGEYIILDEKDILAIID